MPIPVDDPRFGPGAHLLVTGGAGFIGSSFVRQVLGRDDGTRITVLDNLTYAGNEANLQPAFDAPAQAARLRFVRGDIADPATVGPLVAEADAVLNFAAESHVDRSILDPEAFLRTGVIGVHVLLAACRAQAAAVAAGERRTPGGDPRPAPRYLQVSTDEVYGSVESGRSVESDALAPRSPYAAAKASGELLVRSYVVTHGIDAVVTRGSNTFGPYHHPEKLIPLFITNALEDRPLPLYGDGLQQRDWLFVTDHAGAIECVLRRGTSGETYNIPGSAEMTNRDVVRLLLEALGKPWSLVRTVDDRPGHDRRYALDGSKLAALGWRNKVDFADGLRTTIDWFRANEGWWRALKSGDWDAYYERQYGRRLAGSSAATVNSAGSTAAGADIAGAAPGQPGPSRPGG